MSVQPVLISGEWRAAKLTKTFRPENPATGEPLPDEFPMSSWADCDEALTAAAEAATVLRTAPPEQIAKFLTRYAERIEARSNDLVESAHVETGLPKSPRLATVELPRTTNQLRQAAAAALEGSWALPTIDTKTNIRSVFVPAGPVVVFGPNNFPFAFNGVCGGDFAAAVAAGNPVIGKAHPGHPTTSRLIAEEGLAAIRETGLPPATLQVIYKLSPEDGLRLVSDHRIAATAFTGGRAGGLKLKAAADAAGKMIYLEMSSVNPVVILPGALAESGAKIAEEFTGSCLAGSGQFCTNPGLVILMAGENTEQFVTEVAKKFAAAPVAPLLSAAVWRGLQSGTEILQKAGAKVVVGGKPVNGAGYRFENTLLRVSGSQFLAESNALQTEAFGNASLFVVARDPAEAMAIFEHLDGNLTGSFYSGNNGSDDKLYEQFVPLLRPRVGRLLNDKMPTGVAVVASMNHGGPFPATGHAGFTAVGVPSSLRRFAVLQCFDNVRPHRLPGALQNENPNGRMWRLIDGSWSQGDVVG
jgi:NADP-dependent aldehyde dehydrogenase